MNILAAVLALAGLAGLVLVWRGDAAAAKKDPQGILGEIRALLANLQPAAPQPDPQQASDGELVAAFRLLEPFSGADPEKVALQAILLRALAGKKS